MKGWNKKLILFLIISASIFVFACDQQPEITVSEQPPPVSEGDNDDLVSEYGKPMISAYTQGKQAGKTGNLSAVKKTIEAYHATYDKYPESLDEIKHMFSSPIDLSTYDYDPDTGRVSIRK